MPGIVSIDEYSTPEWVKCPGCARLLYGKRLKRNAHVCPECGHHLRLTPRQRIGQLVDAGSFEQRGHDIAGWDPLGFRDRKPYHERLGEAVSRTGEREAAVFGGATISGHDVVIVAMNFAFMGGSMGSAVGEIVTRAAEDANAARVPLILVACSGGARMQEGALSLMQMAKTGQAIARLHEAGILVVSVLTDPTFGGVTASFAMLGHVILAETGALIGFAGRRVISETIRQELPPDFQTAEFLLHHGMVDRVVRRDELRPLVAKLLALHRPAAGGPTALAEAREARETPGSGGQPMVRSVMSLSGRATETWEIVRTARHIKRPTAREYIDAVFADFCELHGDRLHGDDPAIIGGVARLGHRPVMVIGQQKGHDTKELVARRFGMPHPEGYRKALRLMEHAAAFGMPIVTLVDTPGAYPGVDAERRGQSVAIAQAIMRSARLPVPIVCVITGEGGSGGALALATGDRVLLLENAFYSVISPEGCAAILWRTRDSAPAAARALRITAADLLRLEVVDGVVPEPAGGAHLDPAVAAANLRRAISESLDELVNADPAALVAARYDRFRSYGSDSVHPAADAADLMERSA
jgi:acyl-CoA carboxylase subunit beta